MEIIKKNLVVIIIVLSLLVLVVIRSTGINHFKPDAKSWAEPSVKQSNTISIEKLSSLAGDKLFINLGGDLNQLKEVKSMKVSPDSILIKNHLNSILKHNGPVLLYSSEPAISARIWMLLSQMGRKNMYILSGDSDNEILKYKFVRDSLSLTN